MLPWIHEDPTPNPNGVNGGRRSKSGQDPVFAVVNSDIFLGQFFFVNLNCNIPDSSGKNWAEGETCC